jgi:hypothetical protein
MKHWKISGCAPRPIFSRRTLLIASLSILWEYPPLVSDGHKEMSNKMDTQKEMPELIFMTFVNF